MIHIWMQSGVVDHEVIAMHDNYIRFGSWDPTMLEHNTKLNIILSSSRDKYYFYMQDTLIGGREALHQGRTPTTKGVHIALDLPYLYVGQEDWVLLTNSFKAIAPALECN